MCMDPISMLSLAGAGVGAVGSIMGGNANAKAAEIAAQTAQANAKMALDYGEGKVAQINQRVGNVIGAARASYGAGNLSLTSGSPLAVQAMSAQAGNTDKQLALAGALNQSAGQNFQSAQDYSAVGQDRMAGFVGAGTALLKGLGDIRGVGGSSYGGGSSGGGAGAPMNLSNGGTGFPSWDPFGLFHRG